MTNELFNPPTAMKLVVGQDRETLFSGTEHVLDSVDTHFPSIELTTLMLLMDTRWLTVTQEFITENDG